MSRELLHARTAMIFNARSIPCVGMVVRSPAEFGGAVRIPAPRRPDRSFVRSALAAGASPSAFKSSRIVDRGPTKGS